MKNKSIEEFLEIWRIVEKQTISIANGYEKNVQSFLDALRVITNKKIYSENITNELAQLRIFFNKTQKSFSLVSEIEIETFLRKIRDIKNELIF